ncbi:MAG: J domain-containing protein, partial [Clostridiales bacterium]|nr:J domain-containing protein [Clostridiales bacterium]
MTNPYLLLGISPDADTDQVRSAYRKKVKQCHPDQFQDPEKQKEAQETLIALNLAYEAALARAPKTKPVNPSASVPTDQAIAFAQRLQKEGNFSSALRQLIRAEKKDAYWYYVQGNILMDMKQYGSAH